MKSVIDRLGIRWLIAALLAFTTLAVTSFARALNASSTTSAPDAAQWQWFDGAWQITYDDAVLKEVQGWAFIGGNEPRAAGTPHSATIVATHPVTNIPYRADGTAEIVDGRLVITVDNHCPMSGVAAQPAIASATILPIPAGATVLMTLDNAQDQGQVVEMGPPGNLTISFPIPAGDNEIESLTSGVWSYAVRERPHIARSRSGELNESTRVVSGTERWRRPPAQVLRIGVQGQPHPAALNAWRARELALQRPVGSLGRDPSLTAVSELQAKIGPQVIGSIWLTIAGEFLPVQPRRTAKISTNAEGIAVTGRVRAHPDIPRALDFEVALRSGFDARPKKLRLNDLEFEWVPDPVPPAIEGARFVRRARPFEPVSAARDGEVLYLETVYASPPFADRQLLLLESGNGPAVLEIQRTADAPELYRSRRILALADPKTAPAQDRVARDDSFALDSLPPLIADISKAEPLRCGRPGKDEKGGECIDGAPFVMLPVAAGPPPTLWNGALARARVLRRAGVSETEFSNLILTNLLVRGEKVRRSLPVSVEAHAAAILLRRELVAALEESVTQANAPPPIDRSLPLAQQLAQEKKWNVLLRQEAEQLIALAARGGQHPLFYMRVVGPDGNSGWQLYSVLHRDGYMYDVMRRDGRWSGFVAAAMRAIADAKGQLALHTADLSKRAQKPGDQDVRALLKVAGAGLDSIVQRLMLKLVRPARAATAASVGDPPFPRWVPDEEARAHVRSLYVLADAVAAQEAYSAADTAVVVTAVSGAVGGIGIGSSIVATNALARGAIGVAKVATTVRGASVCAGFGLLASDLWKLYELRKQYEAAEAESVDSRGLLSVGGYQAYHAAAIAAYEKRFELMMAAVIGATAPLAISLSAGLLDELLEGAGVIGELNPARALARLVVDEAKSIGVEHLPPAGRRIFDRLLEQARARAQKGGVASLTADDRLVLDVAAGRRAPAADAAGKDAIDVAASAPIRDTDLLGSLDPARLIDESLHPANRIYERLLPERPSPLLPPEPVRYSEADRARVAAFLRDQLELPESGIDQRISLLEAEGLDADAAIAGLHFVHNRSRHHLPLQREEFRAALDRFLERTNPADPDRRAELVNAYLDGELRPIELPTAGRDRLPTRRDTGITPEASEAPESLLNLPPTVVGTPGPGIRQEHIDAVQAVADRTGVPIVIFGSRQTGITHKTGLPFRAESDLDLGVIGDVDDMRAVARIVDPEPPTSPEFMPIPDVKHRPMLMRPTADQLPEQIGEPLIVYPRPGSQPAGLPPMSHLPPPPPLPDPLPPLNAPFETSALPGAGSTPLAPRYAIPPRPDTTFTLTDGRVYRVAEKPFANGLNAQVRVMLEESGKESPNLIAKLFGLQPDPDNPAVPIDTLERAQRIARNNLRGAEALKRLNEGKPAEEQVFTGEIVYADVDGKRPVIVVERIGGATRPPGVTREIVGRDPWIFKRDAGTGEIIQRNDVLALRPEAEDAVINTWTRLIDGQVLCEDPHLGNFSYRVRESPNGGERWQGGLHDLDRVAEWDDIGIGDPSALEIEVRITQLLNDPAELNVHSLAPYTMPDNPRVFMLKMLEFKKYIIFNSQTGKFESGHLDIEKVLKAFPDLYQHVTVPGFKQSRIEGNRDGTQQLRIVELQLDSTQAGRRRAAA